MQLNRIPDAPNFARDAADCVEKALKLLTSAREYTVCAGAHPARKGILAAAVKLEAWRDKLRKAADEREKS